MRLAAFAALSFLLSLPLKVTAIERISALSQRYSDCDKTRATVTQEARKQSRAYILCLLRPMHAEAQRTCDSNGECEKIGLFRAISIVNELIEKDVTIQTPIKKAFGSCDSERLEVFARRALRWVRLGGYQLSSPTAQTSWKELCQGNRALVSVVDILTEAHLRKSPSRD